jgi:hypothetical protein
MVTKFKDIMYDFLKYQMKKTESGKETVYLKALGGSNAGTNITRGYHKDEVIANALADASSDWTNVVSTGAYDASTNFYYKALTNACVYRKTKDSTAFPGYVALDDNDAIAYYDMYKNVLDTVGASAGVATTGDAAWKAFLDTCYDDEQAHDFVFTTMDAWILANWANTISSTVQDNLDTIIAKTDYAAVSGCGTAGGGTPPCSS